MTFIATVIDGALTVPPGDDKFRIKLTRGTTVIYDSQRGDADNADPKLSLGGGSIRVGA